MFSVLNLQSLLGLAVIVEGLAGGLDATAERRLGNDPAAPDLVDDFVLAHHPVAVLDQQHQLGPVAQLHLAANDQPQLVHLGCLPGAHDTGQRAFVSDRQGLVALLARTPEQLFGARCTALEAEVGKAMQLGITRGVHANQPCSQSGPAWLRSR